MSQKNFRFSIENMATRETTAFIGQGETIADAVKDGLKNVTDSFRPKNDGKSRPENGLAVTLKNGRMVNRTLVQFQSEFAFGEEVVAKTGEDLDA